MGLLGAVSAAIVGMALGFTAGWRGGILDEVLQMITNIIVMMPSLVLLVVIGSYLTSRVRPFRGHIHRADHMALGGARGSGPDVLAAVA